MWIYEHRTRSVFQRETQCNRGFQGQQVLRGNIQQAVLGARKWLSFPFPRLSVMGSLEDLLGILELQGESWLCKVKQDLER
jgi:hypothetical protein